MLDINYFKNVNNTFGHPTGNEVLAEPASRIKGQLKQRLLRNGGEEFSIILPGGDKEKAKEIAEMIRATVSTALFPLHPAWTFPLESVLPLKTVQI